MLTESDVEHIAATVKAKVNPKWLRRMYKETRNAPVEVLRRLVRLEFESELETLIRNRPKITLPTVEQLEGEVLMLIETTDAESG